MITHTGRGPIPHECITMAGGAEMRVTRTRDGEVAIWEGDSEMPTFVLTHWEQASFVNFLLWQPEVRHIVETHPWVR